MKLREKKLGREKALGLATSDDDGKPEVIIDPRQDSRERMDTVIHEGLHHICPDWSESKITKAAKKLAALLWNDRFRRVQE
jgi:hypothetical protein